MTKITKLTNRALIRLSGSDVQEFLQNLITCDVAKLDLTQASFGALLSPQGKVLYEFFIQKTAEGFVLDCSKLDSDALAKKLHFYKLRADVTVETVDDKSVFAIWDGELDESFSDPCLNLLGSRIFASQLEENASQDEWHQHRIALGIPELGLDYSSGGAFPHEVLMDQFSNSGVDFSKGCYVGQEVVSRMQHRGTARSRFVMVSAETDLPEMGSELKCNDRKIGTMGSSSGQNGLAIVRLDRVNDAINDGTRILCDDIVITPTLPPFVNFGWS